MWRICLCVFLDLMGIFFVDLYEFVLDLRIFFSTAKLYR